MCRKPLQQCLYQLFHFWLISGENAKITYFYFLLCISKKITNAKPKWFFVSTKERFNVSHEKNVFKCQLYHWCTRPFLEICLRVQGRGWCSRILCATASNRLAPIGWEGCWDAARHVIGPAACIPPAPQPSEIDLEDPALKTGPVSASIRSERIMREIVHIQAGQCGNQIGAKVGFELYLKNGRAKWRGWSNWRL